MTGSPSDLEQRVAACRDRLSSVPGGARSPDGWLFARLVAAREVRGERALLGLSPSELAGLAARHFATNALTVPSHESVAVLDEKQAAFAAAMRDFLIGLAASETDAEDARCLATILAHACLRPDHLWRDLGLSGRDDVTQMLKRFFPEVVARNTQNLRWKKLLARELALSRGDLPGPAPGCPGCEDFGFCFPDRKHAN
jgi:nitrogen fixation protein NifQ